MKDVLTKVAEGAKSAEKKTVTLSVEEANMVLSLMDVAVKAGGLPNAAFAVPIAKNIESQLGFFK